MKTPEQLHDALQPFMRATYKPQAGGRSERWFDWANDRLLGQPAMDGAATGLRRYLDNHLQPDRDFLYYASEELLDAINQAGPLSDERLALGIETWGPVKRRSVRKAIKLMFRALEALEEAQEVHE